MRGKYYALLGVVFSLATCFGAADKSGFELRNFSKIPLTVVLSIPNSAVAVTHNVGEDVNTAITLSDFSDLYPNVKISQGETVLFDEKAAFDAYVCVFEDSKVGYYPHVKASYSDELLETVQILSPENAVNKAVDEICEQWLVQQRYPSCLYGHGIYLAVPLYPNCFPESIDPIRLLALCKERYPDIVSVIPEALLVKAEEHLLGMGIPIFPHHHTPGAEEI